jgi:2-aminoadipate transaminase
MMTMDNIINWMGGWPKEGLVSSSVWEEKLASAADAFRENKALGSARALKERLARELLRKKIGARPSGIRLAAGADDALSRLAAASLSRGDVVITERLTSRSALQLFRKSGIRIVAAGGDEYGLDPDALRLAIRKYRPKLVYISPVCSDPTGRIWRKERREQAVKVCQDAGVCLVRDDRQEMLDYHDGERGVDPVQSGVLSIGQLPPGLVTGLRFGWAAGLPRDLDNWFPPLAGSGGKEDAELSPLVRQALLDLMEEQPLMHWIDMLRAQCRARMKRLSGLLKAVKSSCGLKWREPSGGMHLWLRLPEGLDAEALLRGAWLRGLIFQPGTGFYAAKPERNTLRLTFAFADERQLQAGVKRLSGAIGDFLGRYET